MAGCNDAMSISSAAVSVLQLIWFRTWVSIHFDFVAYHEMRNTASQFRPLVHNESFAIDNFGIWLWNLLHLLVLDSWYVLLSFVGAAIIVINPKMRVQFNAICKHVVSLFPTRTATTTSIFCLDNLQRYCYYYVNFIMLSCFCGVCRIKRPALLSLDSVLFRDCVGTCFRYAKLKNT